MSSFPLICYIYIYIYANVLNHYHKIIKAVTLTKLSAVSAVLTISNIIQR